MRNVEEGIRPLPVVKRLILTDGLFKTFVFEKMVNFIALGLEETRNHDFKKSIRISKLGCKIIHLEEHENFDF